MRLTEPGSALAAWPGAATATAALTDHLSTTSASPIAVAFSGGADSLALLVLARAWAAGHGRRVLALSLDHGLQAAGAAWIARCRDTAERLGVDFQDLRWIGSKPATGLPAAARRARHALIAEAARAAGARVILFGHTATDLAEAQAMRAAGGSTPAPRAWSPSPVWPEGRGLFVLRPLLAASRAEIRRALAAEGWTWIDDPANADPRYARARARRSLGEDAAAPQEEATPGLADLARRTRISDTGAVEVDRRTLGAAGAEAARRWLSVAALSAGGGGRPSRPDRVAALAARLERDAAFVASLAGTRVEATPDAVRLSREIGERKRAGLGDQPLEPGAATVWDGRFEIAANRPAVVRPLAGRMGGLSREDRARLTAWPAAERGALPLVVFEDGRAAAPHLEAAEGATVRGLVADRVDAALGLTPREPD